MNLRTGFQRTWVKKAEGKILVKNPRTKRLKLTAITLKAPCSNIQQNEAAGMMKTQQQNQTELQKMKRNRLMLD